MEVELTVAEQKLAQYLATKRHQAARKTGVKNSRIGPQSDEQTDLEGIGAELAFCKIMNIYPDLQFGERPIEDAVLPDGRTVDIKTTQYKQGRLLAVPWKKPNIDLFALMVGTFPKYRFAGMMTADELLRTERLTDLGHGEGYAATQAELFR